MSEANFLDNFPVPDLGRSMSVSGINMVIYSLEVFCFQSAKL